MTRHYVLAVALFLCVVPGKAQTDGDCLADTLLGPLPSSPVGEEEPIATEITSPAGEDGRGLLGRGLLISPMSGYLTVLTSRYYSNDEGDIIYTERAGLEAMHNVRVNVRVVEGDPSLIRSLTCAIGGLASRFDIAHSQLLGPSAGIADAVTMDGRNGTTLFRLLGAAADSQPLTLRLVQTDGREQQVEVDATPVLHDLRPTPFELSLDGATAEASTDVRVEIETTVNIDVELHVVDDGQGGIALTATLSGWYNQDIDINAK